MTRHLSVAGGVTILGGVGGCWSGWSIASLAAGALGIGAESALLIPAGMAAGSAACAPSTTVCCRSLQPHLCSHRTRPDDPSSTWDAGTWTYRAYNPEREIWEMQGINTNMGAWQPGLMWTAGDDRLLTEWYGTMFVRFRYFAIEPDRFLWRADSTFDRGKSWIRDYWTMEVHRISR